MNFKTLLFLFLFFAHLTSANASDLNEVLSALLNEPVPSGIPKSTDSSDLGVDKENAVLETQNRTIETTSEEKAKKLYQRYQTLDDKFDKEEKDQLYRNLKLNTAYFRDELIEDANNSFYESYIHGQQEIEALIKLDPVTAEKILKNLQKSKDSVVRAFALTKLYENGIVSKDANVNQYRKELIQISNDPNYQSEGRRQAIASLLSTEWDGFDKFYLGLFADSKLIDLHNPRTNTYGEPLLIIPVKQHPDYWFPKLIELINKGQTIRQSAVRVLLKCRNLEKNDLEILAKKLLPLLENYSWASKESQKSYLYLLAKVSIPEAEPGLLKIFKSGSSYESELAASALFSLKSKEAQVECQNKLKSAPYSSSGSYEKKSLVKSCINLGAFTDSEIVNSIFYYSRVEKEKVERDSSPENALKILIGDSILYSRSPQRDSFISLFYEELNREYKKEPEVGDYILAGSQSWISEKRADFLVSELEENFISEEIINQLLYLIKINEFPYQERLQALFEKNGIIKGVSVALLANTEESEKILKGKDIEAQQALLTVARLKKYYLPEDLIIPLYKNQQNSLLLKSAEKYLLMLGTEKAENAIRKDSKVFCGGEFLPLNRFSFSEDLLKQDGPSEIYAIVPNSMYANLNIQVRVNREGNGDVQVVTQKGVLERELSKDEISQLKNTIVENGYDRLSDLGEDDSVSINHPEIYRYVHITKAGGRCVEMYEPRNRSSYYRHYGKVIEKTDYQNLISFFENLTEPKKLKIAHPFLDQFRNGEAVYSDTVDWILAFWKDESSMQVLIKLQNSNEIPKWRILKDGVLGKEALAPADFESRCEIDNTTCCNFGYTNLVSDGLWIRRMSSPTPGILSSTELMQGCRSLFKKEGNNTYSNPVVTPDKKWAFLTSSRGIMSGQSNNLVKLSLEDYSENQIDIKPTNYVEAVVFLSVHKAVLVYRSGIHRSNIRSTTREDLYEYFLVNPDTDEAKKVTGEFKPLWHSRTRTLQHTSKENIVWATIYNDKTNISFLGYYDMKNFSFEPVVRFPSVRLTSADVWVDEKNDLIFFVNNGSLFKMPLSKNKMQ